MLPETTLTLQLCSADVDSCCSAHAGRMPRDERPLRPLQLRAWMRCLETAAAAGNMGLLRWPPV